MKQMIVLSCIKKIRESLCRDDSVFKYTRMPKERYTTTILLANGHDTFTLQRSVPEKKWFGREIPGKCCVHCPALIFLAYPSDIIKTAARAFVFTKNKSGLHISNLSTVLFYCSSSLKFLALLTAEPLTVTCLYAHLSDLRGCPFWKSAIQTHVGIWGAFLKLGIRNALAKVNI